MNASQSWLQIVSVTAVACAAVVAAQSPAPDSRIVAEIGGARILASDVTARLAAERRRDLGGKRLDWFTSKATARTLDRIVEIRQLAAGARVSGLDRRPEIKRQIEALVDEFLADTLVAETAARHAPTDDAVRAYYAAHASEFPAPGRVRARHIVVRTQAEAVALYGKVKRNADFGELARAHNVDSTKATGGELGWVSRGVMVPAFEQVLFALRAGEIGHVLQTSYGFHIVQVQEIEPPKPKAFEGVANEVRDRLVRQAVEEMKAALAKQYPARVHHDVLKGLR